MKEAPMGFEVFTAQVESGRGATKIVLSGELDLETVPILEEYLGRVEAAGVAAIVIDLRELTFVDSVGLRAFLAARDRAEANGHQLLLVGAKEPVRRVFALTGQESLLDNQDAVRVDP
jgi:anti-sigma B factor antagonist